jgi:phosphohistidine phosphatase SixA
MIAVFTEESGRQVICMRWVRIVQQSCLALCALLALGPVRGQPLAGPELISALRAGGLVVVMRHASSPRTPPDSQHANADNVLHERQLDEAGRTAAEMMGQALTRLRIPVGQVLSSPTYRARETIRLAHLGRPQTYAELGDGGESMKPDPSGARAAWLRAKVAQASPRAPNTFIVTHLPNITEAFPKESQGLGDGEALIFRPDGRGGTVLIARVKIEDWPRMRVAP